jgi:hypothetical protein
LLNSGIHDVSRLPAVKDCDSGPAGRHLRRHEVIPPLPANTDGYRSGV